MSNVPKFNAVFLIFEAAPFEHNKILITIEVARRSEGCSFTVVWSINLVSGEDGDGR